MKQLGLMEDLRSISILLYGTHSTSPPASIKTLALLLTVICIILVSACSLGVTAPSYRSVGMSGPGSRQRYACTYEKRMLALSQVQGLVFAMNARENEYSFIWN